MAEKNFDYMNIPEEKFRLVQEGEKLSDKKFSDKPIGYFKDAWIRFRRNRASVIATVIILFIVLFALLTPLLNTRYDATFMDAFYAKKAPRNLLLREIGICDGGVSRDFSEKALIRAVAIGIGAADYDGHGATLEEGMDSEYQPMLRIGDPVKKLDATRQEKTYYSGRIDAYLEVGFLYRSIEQSEYSKIVAWEQETGKKVLYPLVETNEYNMDPSDANNWFKAVRNQPVSVDEMGNAKAIKYKAGMVLEDHYKRDEDGTLKDDEYTGGGTGDPAPYKVRVL